MSERTPLLSPAQEACHAEPEEVAAGLAHAEISPLELSPQSRYGILAGIWVATFLSSLNTTLVATLLTSISSEFNRANQASWLGTAFLLANCTVTPLYGRLSDALGRRGANHVALAFATAGTLLCGLSGSLEMLIAARFLAGLGAGGIFTTCTIITSDMYSLRARGVTQGIASIFTGLGMGLGGPIGGLITDRLGWRWAFLLQLPLFALSFILTSIFLRYHTPGAHKSAKEILKTIDYGGTITLFLSVLSLLTFLSEKYNSATPQPFTAPNVFTPLILAGTFAALFALVELRLARKPVLAPALLKQKVPVIVGISNLLVGVCNFSIMYFFPMWFETVRLESASSSGLHLLPHSMSMSLGSLFAGWAIHKTGKYKTLNLVCGTFTFVAACLLAALREDAGPLARWASIVPAGFGNAVVLQTTLIALLAHVPKEATAVATGFGQVFRGIGQVSGVAASGAIFQSLLDRGLRERLGEGHDELIMKIRHSSKIVAVLPPLEQRAARDSYAEALKAVFIFSAAATAMAYIVRLPLPGKNLDKHENAESTKAVVGREILDNGERQGQ